MRIAFGMVNPHTGEPALLAAPPRDPTGRPAGAPRILVFTDDPDRGGVAQYNHSLLIGLAAAGFRTTCVQPPSRGPLIALQREAGVEHHWLPYDPIGKEFSRSLSDMATPRALFEAIRPDLIVFSDCCPVSNLAAHQTAVALRIPFVVVVGFVAEYLARDASDFLAMIARQYAMAREVVAVSAENLQLLHRHFGLAPDRGRVIHYGRPAAFFAPTDLEHRRRRRAELGLAPETVVALTAARLEPIKGFLHQLEAIGRLDAGSPNHFLWVGEGGQRPVLEREIRRRHWQRRITLVGQQWAMDAWYDLADLYILPSENEGMPLSIMEAMAKSLPVIASAVSGIPEQLGATGQLIPDPKAHRADAIRQLAETIKGWTSDAELRRQVGAAGRDRADRLFREELMVQRTLGLVASLLRPA